MSESEPPRIPLEMLMDFPSEFTFRVVATWSETLVVECRALAEGALGREAIAVEHQLSAQGRYCSVRLTARVFEPAEVHGVYAALQRLPQLRMLL